MAYKALSSAAMELNASGIAETARIEAIVEANALFNIFLIIITFSFNKNSFYHLSYTFKKELTTMKAEGSPSVLIEYTSQIRIEINSLHLNYNVHISGCQ